MYPRTIHVALVLLLIPATSLADVLSQGSYVRLEGLSAAHISEWARRLGSSDAAQRQAAVATLKGLRAESLPGIAARLRQLELRRPDPEMIRKAMGSFRHVVGSKRADDGVDMAPGILPVLAEQRGPVLLAVAEPLLLIRSLEAIGSHDAGILIAEFVKLDQGLWRHEARRVRDQMGEALLPALIELRSDQDRNVKRWARYGVKRLGAERPTAALRQDDPALLAGIIDAYTNPLDFEAMPELVKLVGREQIQVREAARRAVARFGKNAIWQVREAYEEASGQRADRGWDWQRSTRELYLVLDRSKIEEVETRVAQGMAAFVAGDLKTMAQHYNVLLARFPHYPERAKLAPGYAALGEFHFSADRLDAARDAYQRALRLSPQDETADDWKAQLAFISAERTLTRGVVDLHGYSKALALAPSLAAAEEARDRLSGATRIRARHTKRWAAMAAIGLLLALMLLLVKPRKQQAT